MGGAPRQATPGSSPHHSPSDPLHDEGIYAQHYEHKDTVLAPSATPMLSLQPDRQTGPEELQEVGDLQGLVGWGIKQLGERGNSSWSEEGVTHV